MLFKVRNIYVKITSLLNLLWSLHQSKQLSLQKCYLNWKNK